MHWIGAYRPWKIFRAWSKRIATGAAEGMPVGNREPEVFFHRFLTHLLSGVVKLESHWVIRFFALVFDLAYAFKILFVA